MADAEIQMQVRESDVCPICKSSRYLNPNLKFLVNPECYHKMCESCMDRIFNHGPAPCPVAGCGRTLRRQRFRKQTFEDLQIEREVDIRRRVAAIFNRRQDEFESLRAFNDYLEEVENLTFNLLYEVDVKQTEAKLAAYAAQNADIIAQNAALARTELSSAQADILAQKQEARLRREESIQEQESERLARLEADREAQDRIARGLDPAGALQPKVVLKKSTARRRGANKATGLEEDENGAPAPLFEIQGLKPRQAANTKVDYDPFDGLVLKHGYYNLQMSYDHPWLDAARSDPAITTGGYNVQEYCARAIFEAFAGLGIVVTQEVQEASARNNPASLATATQAAAMAVGPDKSQDGDVL